MWQYITLPRPASKKFQLFKSPILRGCGYYQELNWVKIPIKNKSKTPGSFFLFLYRFERNSLLVSANLWFIFGKNEVLVILKFSTSYQLTEPCKLSGFDHQEIKINRLKSNKANSLSKFKCLQYHAFQIQIKTPALHFS